MAKYTYKLAIGAASGELFVPDKDAVYEWKEEGQYDGFMRKNIKELIITRDYDDGSGTPPNTDLFDTLWEYYFDSTKQTTELTITIYKDSVLDYTGLFYIKDGDIDVNDGVYILKATIDDTYREFLQLLDNDVNIIDASGGYEATLSYTTTYQTYDTAVSGLPLPAPSGSWELIPGVGSTTWARQKSLYDDAGTGYSYQGYYYFPEWNAGNPITLNFSFPNCFLLTERIQYFLTQLLASVPLILTLSSEFFTAAINYVTGANPNMLQYTLINQKTDTKDPDATNKATKGTITFNQLMADLKAMYNVRWYIKKDGGTDYLVIEHEKFFYQGLSKTDSKGTCIDLTDSAKYVDASADEYYIANTQNYVSAKVEPIKSETIKFADEDTTDFRAEFFKIEYDTLADKAMNKEYPVVLMSTDIGKAINNADDIDNNGFYLFNCGSTSVIITREENSGGDDIANAAFSVKWLLHDYYEYGRPDKSGTLSQASGSTTSTTYAVLGTVPIYLQKDIVFLLNNADSIDINEYIATYLIKSSGTVTVDGTIIEIEHDLYDDFVTVTLGYEI